MLGLSTAILEDKLIVDPPSSRTSLSSGRPPLILDCVAAAVVDSRSKLFGEIPGLRNKIFKGLRSKLGRCCTDRVSIVCPRDPLSVSSVGGALVTVTLLVIEPI